MKSSPRLTPNRTASATRKSSSRFTAWNELPEFIREHSVKMAILTVPAAVAQEVANPSSSAGITGILNFAPIVLSVPEEVMVNNVNLAIELENLSYFTQE